MVADLLGPHVVGRRVVVRRVLRGETGPSGGPALSDVLGVCESWADGVVTLRREQGDLVTIATADIVAGKPVPARPSRHRRLSPEAADRLAVPGWLPEESAPLGDWVLRAAGGFSSRANSVLALGDPGRPLAAAVAEVAAWYAARGLAPRAHVHPGDAAASTFAAAGWAAYDETALLLTSVARAARRTGRGRPAAATVQHASTLDEAWVASDPRAARHGDAARHVLEAGEVVLATVREQGRVIARGRGSVHGDWLGIASLWTDPDRRGEGLGTTVLADLIGWGAERGATTAYLQVVSGNRDALRLYLACGFEEHHRYAYYTPGEQQ